MIDRRYGAIVVATLLVAGCGGPGPTSRATVSPPAATPAPSGDVSAPTAAASSSPTPSATPAPRGEAIVVVIRWRVAAIPPMFGRRDARPRAAAAGKGSFVAVGDRTFRDTAGRPAGGRAGTWRSANGVAWRPSTFGSGVAVGDDIPLSGPQAGLADVTWGSGGFVAVGIVLDGGRVLGRAWRSRDGRSWTVARLPGEGRARPASVTWSGDRYVAVGVVEAAGAPRAAAWLSDDGRAWRRAADDPAFDIGGYVDTMEYHGWRGPREVTADASEELRALGLTCIPAAEEDGGQACRPMLWQSPDAEEWTRLDPGEVATGSSLSSLASIEGYVVAVGGSQEGGVEGAHVLVPDGAGSWRVVEPPGVPRLDRVVALDRGFLAASTAGGRISLWSSLDGAAWQDVPGVPQPADDVRVLGPIDLVVAGSRIVLVGSAETDSGKDSAFAIVGVLP